MGVPLLVYLCVFFSGGLVEMLLWNRMTRQINQHLPVEEQYSLSIWALRRSAHGEFSQFRIWRLHRRLFPTSYLRMGYVTALIIALIIESIVVERSLPRDVGTLLDFGSGGGLPGIPIAICRSNVAVTLAESQGKKAAFLQEAVRVLGITAKVHADRAQAIGAVFDCVALRAVEKMPLAVADATKLVAPGGWLALMTTDSGLAELQTAAGPHFRWESPIRLPESESRILALGQQVNSQA